MIQLVYGPAARLMSHCYQHHFQDPQTLWLAPMPAFAPPCAVLRGILPQIRKRHGDIFVSRLMKRHRVAASLVLPRIHTELDAQERRARSALVGRLDSNMTHNELAQQRFFDACAELLWDLLDGAALRLVIPDLRRLDATSLDVLRSLFQRDRRNLELVMGYDNSRPQAPFDENGILWEFGPALLDEFVTAFQRACPAVEIDLTALGSARPASFPVDSTEVDTLDDDLEQRTFLKLSTSCDPPSAELCEGAVTSISRAFEVYSFREAMRLGKMLLDRRPQLTDKQSATVHATFALSAHNRQFISKGNTPLAHFLARHTEIALSAETDPALRVCLLYRSAVTLARRLGKLDEAEARVEQAFGVLREVSLSSHSKVLLKAWLHNIRGFIYMRRGGRWSDAAKEEDTAYELLSNHLEGLPRDDVQWTEAQLTLAVLADNLVQLSRGDSSYEIWLTRTEEAIDPWPTFQRLTAREWTNLHRDALDLEAALASCQRCLRLSRASLAALMEYASLANLGDLHYRLGDPGLAHEFFGQAIRLRQRLTAALDSHLPLELGEAAAAAKLGWMERAEDALFRLCQGDSMREPAAAARIWARLGDFAAQSGREELAEQRVNRAIELAVESGARDVLVEVAVAAGRANRLLGRDEEALLAFDQAFEVAGQAGLAGLAPAVGFEILWGQFTCGREEPSLLIAALPLLSAALASDAESWWRLNPFLEALPMVLASGCLDVASNEVLNRLERAAQQRPDCARGLDILRRHLERPGQVTSGSDARPDVQAAQ